MYYLPDGNVAGGARFALDQLHHALYQLLADRNPVGDADEVSVLELDAGPLVAVVVERVDACGEARFVDFLRGFAQRGIGVVHRGDDYDKRSDGDREEHAGVVVVLFDRRTQDTLDTDPVRSHDRRDFLTVRSKNTQAHGVRIFVSQLKDVTDFDGLVKLQLGPASGAGIDRKG